MLAANLWIIQLNPQKKKKRQPAGAVFFAAFRVKIRKWRKAGRGGFFEIFYPAGFKLARIN